MNESTQAQDGQAQQNTNSYEPIFTTEQVFRLEDEYNTTWGVSRRIMMAVLSKDSNTLADIAESSVTDDEEDNAYFTMIEQISDYEQHLNDGIELARAALARLFIAGQSVAAYKQ
jgi:hypothetical protein